MPKHIRRRILPEHLVRDKQVVYAVVEHHCNEIDEQSVIQLAFVTHVRRVGVLVDFFTSVHTPEEARKRLKSLS
jgi:hypothetical protein